MYKKFSQEKMKHFEFLLMDMICLQLSCLLGYMLRHGIVNPYSNKLYWEMAIAMLIIAIPVFLIFETYKNVLNRGYYIEFISTAKQTILVILLYCFYLFAIKSGSTYSRVTVIIIGFLYAISSYSVRILYKVYLKKKGTLNKNPERLLVLTDQSSAKQIIDNLKENEFPSYVIVGIVITDSDLIGQEISGVKVVANKQNVMDYVCKHWIDEVFIYVSGKVPVYEEYIRKFLVMGVTTHLKINEIEEFDSEKHIVDEYANYVVVSTSINNMTGRQAFAKRCIDIFGGIFGCILTLIMTIFIAPSIYIQSPGPIFFSQTRVGRNGKKFKIYKFRSMYMDAEERKAELMKKNNVKDGMMFKMDDDPRIIGNNKGKGIGNFIRKTSLDEFPQFLNVLKGDMSLVGTRPPTVDEWKKYSSHHRARLAIKPGITGMWQVSGRSDITDFEKVVELDRKYIVSWNIGLDIKLLLKTVLVVLKKEGSK